VLIRDRLRVGDLRRALGPRFLHSTRFQGLQGRAGHRPSFLQITCDDATDVRRDPRPGLQLRRGEGRTGRDEGDFQVLAQRQPPGLAACISARIVAGGLTALKDAIRQALG